MDALFDIVGSGTLAVLFVIVIIVLLVAYITGRFKVAGANEALVRTGGLVKAPAQLKVVRAGRVVVLPLVHKLGKLHLSARQINVSLGDAVTKQGIKVAVQGVATVKIGGDDESIRNAAERFVDREDQIDSIVKNVLEGSLRSIVGTLTVEELNYDRQKFQQEVQLAAKGDLATSGLTIDNFTIQAIRDEVGYMDLIGQQETARRERDARMAKATADQEAAVREAEAQQIKLNAQRDVALRQAEVIALTAAAEAKAAQAGPLAQAEAQQEVTRRQTELAQLEADRTQKELIASTIRPAEAEAEAQIRRAEGDKGARIAAAQADAERVKLAGQAEASVQIIKGEAQARVTEVNARGHRQADDARGQRRGRHHLHQGRGRGQGAGPARRGLPPVQRGGDHLDGPLDAAGDRPCRRRAPRPHREPDRALERRRVGRRQDDDPDAGRGLREREGPHGHRHPRAAQQRARRVGAQAAATREAATEAPDRRRPGDRWVRAGRGNAPGRVTRVRRLRGAGERRRARRRRPRSAPRRRAPRHRQPGGQRPTAAPTPEQRFEAAAKAMEANKARATAPAGTPWVASSRRCRPCPRRATCAPVTRAGWRPRPQPRWVSTSRPP